MPPQKFRCRTCKTVSYGTPSAVDKNHWEVPTCPRCGDFEGYPTDEPVTPRTIDANGHADFGRPASHFKRQQETPPEPAAAQAPSPAPLPLTSPPPTPAPAPIAAPEVVVKYDIGMEVKSVTGLEPGKAYFVEITKGKTPEQFKAITTNLINLGLSIGVKFIVLPEGSVVSIKGVMK